MEDTRVTQTSLMHIQSPDVFSRQATLDQVWRHFYKLGCLFARSKDLSGSLGCFIDVFLIRGNELKNPDKVWLDFFSRQFAMYLLGKKQICCSLSEGDMIHDFLREEYEQLRQELEQSEFLFNANNLQPWFDSQELDFPWMMGEDQPMWSFA